MGHYLDPLESGLLDTLFYCALVATGALHQAQFLSFCKSGKTGTEYVGG